MPTASLLRSTAFDTHRLDEAYDELDRLYVEHGGPDLRPYRHAEADRDWDRYASYFAPSFTFRDERPLGWGLGRGELDLAGFLEHARSHPELAPDEMVAIDHVIAHTDPPRSWSDVPAGRATAATSRRRAWPCRCGTPSSGWSSSTCTRSRTSTGPASGSTG